jgi:hypothetical protein
MTLDVADKGIKHGGEGTHATWEDGSAKMDSPDGLMWVKASNADVLIIDEDSGNELGERKFALPIDPETMQPAVEGKGYFLAMAGGGANPRAEHGVSAYGGTFSSATSSEFSGTWPVTPFVAEKDDGSFYTVDEIAGTGAQEIIGSLPLDEQVFIGVVQHKGESGGAVAQTEADQGGQLFMFNLNLPEEALQTAMR